MKYITGIFALNISCSLGTTGDWHRSSLAWDRIRFKESECSVLKEKGIERNVYIRELENNFNEANHIRAIADLLDEGDFPNA